MILFSLIITCGFLVGCKSSQQVTHQLYFNSFGIVIEDSGEVFQRKDLNENKEYTFIIKVDDDFSGVVSTPTQLFIKDTTGNAYTNYQFNANTGELKIALDRNVIITTNSQVEKYPTLNEASWGFIDKISKLDLASQLFTVGEEKTFEINGVPHKIHIIGFNHDDLADGSGKAKITFEFLNPVEAKNPYNPGDQPYIPYTSAWTNAPSNIDFIGGQLNWRLNDEGISTSIISILPNDLRSVIKEVNKSVAAENPFVVKTYKTRLFPLSYREMTAVSHEKALDEGETYEYYKEHTSPSDLNKYYVGDSDSVDSYFTRSPCVDAGIFCWCISNNSGLTCNLRMDDYRPIVPSFCI